MTTKPSTLDIARRMLLATAVAKSEGADLDPRAAGASPTPEDLAAAKQEAQAGAAAAAPADGGDGGDGGGAPGGGEPPASPSGTAPSGEEPAPPTDDQVEVAKAIVELLGSSGLTWEQVAMLGGGADTGPLGQPVQKAGNEGSFSGGEYMPGDPKADFGANAAQKQLEEILGEMKRQGKVQEDMKKQIEDLLTDHNKVAESVAKAQEASASIQDTLSGMEGRLAAAEATGTTISQALGALPRTAAAAAPKAVVAKAEGAGMAMPMVGGRPIPYRTHEELMKACMEGKVEPGLTPAYNRAITVFNQQQSH